jgi:acetyl-CoA carboxylase biotin carboxyl carrier protein
VLDHSSRARIAFAHFSTPFTKGDLALDLKEIKELIALMKRNELSEFQLEQGDFKIKLKKGGEIQQIIAAPAAYAAPSPTAGTSPSSGSASAAPSTSEAGAAPGKEIVSPMVGTFYASPSPESPLYVEVGQQVSEETVVCIIEAMKVMNEIKAEMKGTITEILAENGKPVQFGQALFRLK